MITTFDQLLEKMEESYEAWTMRGQVIEVPVREAEGILIIARELKRLRERMDNAR